VFNANINHACAIKGMVFVFGEFNGEFNVKGEFKFWGNFTLKGKKTLIFDHFVLN